MNWIDNSGLTSRFLSFSIFWVLLDVQANLQETSPFLSAQMALLSGFLQVSIVLVKYNYPTAFALAFASMLLSFLLSCLCTVELRLDHLGSFRIPFFFCFLLYRNCTRGLASYAAVHVDKKSAVINFLSLGSVFGYTADTFCLLFHNRGDQGS